MEEVKIGCGMKVIAIPLFHIIEINLQHFFILFICYYQVELVQLYFTDDLNARFLSSQRLTNQLNFSVQL